MTVFGDVVLCSLVVVYDFSELLTVSIIREISKLRAKNWVEKADQISHVKYVLRTSTEILDGVDELN
jgi:hypothetical protein